MNTAVYYINLILLIVDIVGLLSILVVILFMNKAYMSFEVPRINSANDVITSGNIEKMLHEFKAMYNLKDYEINYVETEKQIKIFRNLNNRAKTITITKGVFESVGYELDYLISRIWISAKLLNKDRQVRIYRATLTYIPFILILTSFIAMVIHGIIFILAKGNMTLQDSKTQNEVLHFFTTYPIFGIISFVSLLGLFANYIISMKFKPSVEMYYNSEINSLVKITMPEYASDFIIARTYAQDISVTYIPLIRSVEHNRKWMGPFVRM